ncbi:hypothetical protein ALC60_09317, partial [Trachymyrmex zeteki]
ESKDVHYLIAAFVVISAEDGELLRPGNRCIVKTGVGRYRRSERGWARFLRSRDRDARRRPGVGHSPLLSTRRLVPLSANT